MIRQFIATVALFAAGTFLSSTPVAAQAKGSADAMAAKRTNPHGRRLVTRGVNRTSKGSGRPTTCAAFRCRAREQYGTRKYLSDEEFAKRAKQRGTARDVDNARTGTFRNEEGSRDFSYTSMVIDPPDGRVPGAHGRGAGATPLRRDRSGRSVGEGPGLSLYDRCITRGAIGSFMPAVYGNGARIIQTPDSVVISYEMVHDTRVIRSTAGPPIGRIHLWMGDCARPLRRRHARDRIAELHGQDGGRRRAAQRGAAHGRAVHRVDPEMIDYEVHIDDPATFTKPWTFRMTITSQPGYRDLRIRLPRRQQRDAERAHRRARLREGRRRGKGQGTAAAGARLRAESTVTTARR
jgi:hypothetical protein